MPDTKQRHTVAAEGGLHLDGDKPRMADTIPADLLLAVGRIFAQNNAEREGYPGGKYPDLPGGIPNFKGGIRASKLFDSMNRHYLAALSGEDRDPCSGEMHLAHLVCNVSMLWWMLHNRPDLDDRNAAPEPNDDVTEGHGLRCPADPETYRAGICEGFEDLDRHIHGDEIHRELNLSAGPIGCRTRCVIECSEQRGVRSDRRRGIRRPRRG
jgi:hypothetical protein